MLVELWVGNSIIIVSIIIFLIGFSYITEWIQNKKKLVK